MACIVSCTDQPHKDSHLKPTTDQTAAGEQPAARIDHHAGQSPYLTRDDKGQILLSWVRLPDNGPASFCYASSYDAGKTFSKPVVIPHSDNIQPHSENLPKIIRKPSGEMIALWGAANPNPVNKHSGLVFYSQSVDNGQTWSARRPLVDDTASFDQRYYDVAVLPDGELGIIWLDNRKTGSGDGAALYFSSTDGRKGFKPGIAISEPCCPCCRTDLYIDDENKIHILYRGIIQDSIRDMLHMMSSDGGNKFSVPQRISEDNWVINTCPHTGPSMTVNKTGAHFAWFTGGKKPGCYYRVMNPTARSSTVKLSREAPTGKLADVTHPGGHSGHAMSEAGYSRHGKALPHTVSEHGSHPQLTSLSNGNVVIAWDEAYRNNDGSFRRICLQERTADGNADKTVFITPLNSVATYPVIVEAGNNVPLIAFTDKKADTSYVMFQRVVF